MNPEESPPVPLRLWAGLDTITFEEFSYGFGGGFGETIEVAFGLTAAFLRTEGEPDEPAWKPEFAALGSRALVPLPHLGQTVVGVTGLLLPPAPTEFGRRIESATTLYLLDADALATDAAEPLSCEAIGTLSITGTEVGSRRTSRRQVKLLGFRSFDLDAGSITFGKWCYVDRPSDLRSDPDVVDFPVLVAWIELDL